MDCTADEQAGGGMGLSIPEWEIRSCGWEGALEPAGASAWHAKEFRAVGIEPKTESLIPRLCPPKMAEQATRNVEGQLPAATPFAAKCREQTVEGGYLV